MASHSSTFAWKIPWTEEPGGLQSMGSLEADITERLHFHFSLSCIGEGNGNLLQCSCLENPRDGEAWWAAVSGVTQSRTRLKRLSSSFCSVLSTSDLYCALPCMKYSLDISNFLEEISLSHSIVLLYLFCCFSLFLFIVHLRRPYLSLSFSVTLHSLGCIFPFLPCLLLLFFPQLSVIHDLVYLLNTKSSKT